MSDFETVKQRADIVDVVSGYANLERAGSRFKACCPFHQEKTPSFYVTPENQTWHCFGACSTGGDVIRFIEKKENLTPVEALRMLAERYGVTLERRGPRPDEPAIARLVEANETAATFFHHLLLNNPVAEDARAYTDKRGLDAETLRSFSLGFAPDTWDTLRNHLVERGFTPAELVAAGLLSEGEKGTPYDRFRGRLMFPIRDDRGRAIGFGGRVLGEGVPKYLNTPQTPLFDKGATLYALDRAKDSIRADGSAVVVEGYMDAITAHQHGITNVIATLGTALTERHVGLLKRYARRVILSMDADAAGIEAALRGEELVRNATPDDPDAPVEVTVDWRNLVRVQAAAPVEVRVFTVPQGKDPDEAIRSDPAAFRELAERAVPPFEFRLRHELAAIDQYNPRERLALADRLLPLIRAVADRTVQAQYLARLGQATAISEDVLAARLTEQSAAGGQPLQAAPLRLRESARPRRGEQQPVPPPAPPAGAPPPRETYLLKLLLVYEGLRAAGETVEEDIFTDPDHRALFQLWKAHPGEELSPALDEQGHAHLARVLAHTLPPMDDALAARAFTDAVARMRKDLLSDRTRLLVATLHESRMQSSEGAETSANAATETTERFVQQEEMSRRRLELEAGLRTGRAVDVQETLPPTG